MQRLLLFSALLLLAFTACAPARSSTPGGDSEQEPRTGGSKRFTAAIRGDPPTVYQKPNPRSNIPGIDDLERLDKTGVTVGDPDGNVEAQLAEAVPSIDNGLW